MLLGCVCLRGCAARPLFGCPARATRGRTYHARNYPRPLTLPTLAAQADMASKSNPSDFLKTVLGRPVVVKLNSGVDYRGVLACLDGYMNIAMEQTEEYQNGQLKAKYGDTFIRGNNVLYISTQKKKS